MSDKGLAERPTLGKTCLLRAWQRLGHKPLSHKVNNLSLVPLALRIQVLRIVMHGEAMLRALDLHELHRRTEFCDGLAVPSIAGITDIGGDCKAIEIAFDNEARFLATDKDELLAWERADHHGWSVGLSLRPAQRGA